ncbi:2418_t:CDS:2, partial [Diversispora eburnea]
QSTLEGLFGIIRELGKDSSTQILKSYGHALNKYQITALVSSKIKSFNYGNTSCNGYEISNLTRRIIEK